MANALQLFKILYKTQHKPVHKLWLRFEENEVNDKSGKGGVVLSWVYAAPTEYLKFWSLIGNGLLKN